MLVCCTVVLLQEALLRFHTSCLLMTAIYFLKQISKRLLWWEHPNEVWKISGQCINYNKSTVILTPNSSTENKREICAKLGVQEIQNLGKYLGMPMQIGRSKVTTFAFLLDRVEQRMQGWSNWYLSKAGKGKLLLLKTAAQAIPNSWMSLFFIPNEVVRGLSKKWTRFGGGMEMQREE